MGAEVSKMLRLPLVYFRNLSFKSNDKHKYSSPKTMIYFRRICFHGDMF